MNHSNSGCCCSLLQYFTVKSTIFRNCIRHLVYFQQPGNLKEQGIMCDEDSSRLQNIQGSEGLYCRMGYFYFYWMLSEKV
jgi:hypothetical protein